MLDFSGEASDDPGQASAPAAVFFGKGAVVEHSSTMAEVEDTTALLVRVAVERDRQAFARLFQHYAPRLKSYMRKLGCDDAVAEDLAQEAMLAVWRKADRFDPAKSGAGTWIFTIARNLRIDRLRRERRPEVDEDDLAEMPDDSPPADEALANRRSGEKIRRAVADLPTEQAQVVTLSFYEDHPHADIAARLGIPLGTVKSRLRLAMKRIRATLGDEM